MNAVKLKTPKELERFLRILAEESVSAAKGALVSGAEEKLQKRISKEIPKSIADLREVEPAAPEAAPAEKPSEKSPPPQQPEEKPAAPEPASKATAPKDADINPSLDDLIDAIKDMRGGKGTSDTIVKDALSAYYDRLEAAEKAALVVMLRSVAGIMGGKFANETPPEPSDYNIYTTKRAPEGGESSPAPEKPTAPADSSPAGEDTSPPIQVGQPVSEAYRAKIKNLLNRRS